MFSFLPAEQSHVMSKAGKVVISLNGKALKDIYWSKSQV